VGGGGLSLRERLETLSGAEREVVRALKLGRSYRQIALDRNCSENTVRTLIRRAYRKLAISSRYELPRA
jgi:LuxR family maltose regulon positive regulatory protein